MRYWLFNIKIPSRVCLDMVRWADLPIFFLSLHSSLSSLLFEKSKASQASPQEVVHYKSCCCIVALWRIRHHLLHFLLQLGVISL